MLPCRVEEELCRCCCGCGCGVCQLAAGRLLCWRLSPSELVLLLRTFPLNLHCGRYYSRSIFVNPHNAVVWANRAMAHLRLKQFDQAEADCSEAIRLDPTYVKAISRRAMTCVE